MEEKHKLLIELDAAINITCKIYADHTKFLANNKALLIAFEKLPKQANRKFSQVQSQVYKYIYLTLRDVSQFHVFDIQAFLNKTIKDLPPVIHELLKMELRRLGILDDTSIVPGSDFNLHTEISRYIYIRYNEIDDHLIPVKGNKEVANERKIIISMLNNYFANLQKIKYQNGKNEALNIASKLVQLRKIKDILSGESCHTLLQNLQANLEFNAIDALDNVYQYHHQLVHDLKTLNYALAKLNYKLKGFTDLNTVADKLMSQVLEKETVTTPSILDNNLLLSEFNTHQTEFTHTEFTISVQNVKISTNQNEPFKFRNSLRNIGVDFIIIQDKEPKIKILNNYGASLAIASLYKIRGSKNKSLVFSINYENIYNEFDLTATKELIMRFISSLDHASYHKVQIGARQLMTLKELIMLSFQYELKEIDIPQNTFGIIKDCALNAPADLSLYIDPKIRNLFYKCQNLLNIGFIPDLKPESIEALRIRSMAQTSLNSQKIHTGQELLINVSCGKVSILQALALAKIGVNMKFTKDSESRIAQYIKTNGSFLIDVFALTFYDLQHRIQTVLDLGFIPTIMQTQPKIILERKLREISMHKSSEIEVYIKNQDPNIAYSQLVHCIEVGLPVRFNTLSVANKIASTIDHTNKTPIIINSDSPQTAINTMEELAHANIVSTFSIPTKHLVLKYLSTKEAGALPKLKFKFPNKVHLKYAYENGMLVKIDKLTIKSILKHQEEELELDVTNINFAGYPINSISLICEQIKQLDNLIDNYHLNIKYFCDSNTQDNNKFGISNYLQSLIQEYLCFCIARLRSAKGKIKGLDEGDIEKLLTSLKTVSQKDGMMPLTRMALIETNIMNIAKKQNQVLDIINQSHEFNSLQRTVHALSFNINKTSFVKLTSDRCNKYVNLAKDLTNRTNEQDFVNSFLRSHPELGNPDATEVNEHVNTHSLMIIHKTCALSEDELASLSTATIIERIHILGNRIANGLILDSSLQTELKSLSIRLSLLQKMDS